MNMATIMGMTTATRTAMTTELPAPLLALMWLASPALPVGGFSYSEGLEAAIEHGLVHDEASCAVWLNDQLMLTQVRGDMAVLARAITAWRQGDEQRLQALADWVSQTRESAEMRLQTEQMGRSLQEWMRNLGQVSAADLGRLSRLPPSYPIAYALAMSIHAVTPEQALQAWAFAWAENMVQAAIKAVPLGQSSGQRLLARLARQIGAATQAALQVDDEQRQAYSPMLAILSARHETQYSRLFRS
jgi:urease accessory protein